MEDIKKTAIKETAKDVLGFLGMLAIALVAIGIFALALATIWGAVVVVVAIILFIFYLIYLTHLEDARIEQESKQHAIEQAEKIKAYIKDVCNVRVGRDRAYVKDAKGVVHTFDYNGKYYELVKSIVYGD